MCIWPPRVSVGSSQWSARRRPVIALYSSARRISPAVATGRPSSVNAAAPASASSPISVSCVPSWPTVIAAVNPTGICGLLLGARPQAAQHVGRVDDRDRCSASRGSRSSRRRPRRRCPDAIVSSSSRPGVRRWTCGSTNAGASSEPGAVDHAVAVDVEPLAERRDRARRRSGRRAPRRRPRSGRARARRGRRGRRSRARRRGLWPPPSSLRLMRSPRRSRPRPGRS